MVHGYNTRNNRTGPLWAGIEHGQIGRIQKRKRAIRVLGFQHRFTQNHALALGLPPVPALHVPRSRNRMPERLINCGGYQPIHMQYALYLMFDRVEVLQRSQARTEPPPSAISSIAGLLRYTRDAAPALFSQLHLADYNNLRLVERSLAWVLPPYQRNSPLDAGHVNISNLSWQCQNHRFVANYFDPTATNAAPQGRILLPLPIDAPFQPRLPFIGPLLPTGQAGHMPPRTTPRVRCPRIDPKATQPQGTGPGFRYWHVRENAYMSEEFTNCDGTTLGYNLNNRFHPPDFKICGECAYRAFDHDNIAEYHPEFLLPYCYDCSKEKIGGPQWFQCQCDIRNEPFPDRDHFYGDVTLCTDCRGEQARQMTELAVVRCERYNLRPRDVTKQGLERWVHDWDAEDRNFCVCGKKYMEILWSYPVNRFSGAPDLTRMFRECLLCRGHQARYNPAVRGVCHA